MVKLKAIAAALDAVEAAMRASEGRAAEAVEAAHPDQRASARNLLHSLGLNDGDLGALDESLAELGLACFEPTHPFDSLERLRGTLTRLQRHSPGKPAAETLSRAAGRLLRARHAEALLGPAIGDRPRLMVTAPGSANDGGNRLGELVRGGVSCVRIDGTRGDPATWKPTLRHLRRLRKKLRRPCPSVLDLGGPRPCTGELEAGPEVVHWDPRRDDFGSTLSPARLWLVPEDRPTAPVQPVDAVLPVSSKLASLVDTEDRIRFKDARGRRRELRIRGAGRSGCLAESDQTTFLESGAALRLERNEKVVAKGKIGALPSAPRPLVLHPGDVLLLTRKRVPGRPAQRDGGFVVDPARISCTLPAAFDGIRAGERVVFAGGALAGLVESASAKELKVRITRALPEGSHLRAGAGIHLPDSRLDLPVLENVSSRALEIAARHADAVALTVERPADVLELHGALASRRADHLGWVLRIASRRGLEALAEILLAAMRRSPAGLELDLGALAAELGNGRLAGAVAEVRQQTESAHVPLIWTAPEIEGLATVPATEADVEDAVAGVRAECLTLGPGPHLGEALSRLTEVSSR